MLVNKPSCLLPITLLALLLTSITLYAQTAESRTKEEKAHRKKVRHFSDSTWRKNFNITDTSAARIINRIQDINTTLNDINDILDNGYDTSEISENLPEFERSIKIIHYNISNLSGSQNLNNLSLMQTRLNEMSDDLKDWQGSLLDYYTVLVGRNSQLRALSLDSTVHELPTDTALRYLYLRQLKELKSRTASTDSITRKSLLKIDLLQSTVYNRYVEVIDLQKKVKNLIKAYDKKALSNEYGYLWQPPAKDSATQSLGTVLQRSIKGSNRILQYHMEAIRQLVIINAILTLAFFCWMLINLRKIKLNQEDMTGRLQYVQSIPVLPALIFLFTFMTFLDLHPPAIYTAVLQLLLIISLTLLLMNRWPRKLFAPWSLLVLLFIFYNIKNLMVTNTYSARLLTFGVDILSIVLGYIFFKKIKQEQKLFPGYFKGLTIIYIFLNLSAALSNLFGRVTLSQVLGYAAVSNFIQAIGLIVFIQVALEAVFLQLEADKKSKRFSAYLNYQNVESRLRRILTIIAGVYWFINLCQNLNLYDQAYQIVSDFLNAQRYVGSTSFTLGSILVFFVVVWISNILQKYIGYFFGDTNDDVTADKKTRLGTSILLVRLLVLTAGFLLGVLASGIPLDKVTIIIGALGVGIGLGLQNIVNNLVSGVILAIERPIQVGDLIEISGNSGRVKDIGIRSSRIVTAEGAEVIIPNGDMLSQKLTNWTLSNTFMRVEINIKLGEGADLDKARTLILDLLQKNEEVMPKPEPQVLFRGITDSGADVQILFWAFDLNKGIQLKSDVLQKIFTACHKENIPVTG
jgi:small-conductance mechanosensitive channel